MKLPDFTDADVIARRALMTGQPIPAITQAALGLRFWWRMPRCLRATASGEPRARMIRRYAAAVRCARNEQGA